MAGVRIASEGFITFSKWTYRVTGGRLERIPKREKI